MTSFIYRRINLLQRDSRPLLYFLLAQLAGVVLAAGLIFTFPAINMGHLIAAAFLQSVLAALVARILRVPVWWLLIHLLFMPGIVLASGLALSPWVWFGGFSFLLLVFWRTDISQVPLYLTNRQSRNALLALLPSSPCRMIDIGCGDGGLLRYLAKARPDCQFVGIEHAPLTWAWAKAFAVRLPNLEIFYGDFWSHALSSYHVVYAFLSPAPMRVLGDKALAEMMPLSIFISNSFIIPNMTPQQSVDVADHRKTRFYIYVKPSQQN
ncbi:MAG: class I SAM-dependent methyltransferase [Rugosibacter sp.]|nr:class I SAM-dependent methyltransferase [Rugosibacter sp.]